MVTHSNIASLQIFMKSDDKFSRTISLVNNFDFQSFQLQLRVCIDTNYSEGVYFSHLERESLECVLYGTQEAVRSKINPIYG